MGFSKKITKNKIAPKDGSEPLTVIEFSLTNETRERLERVVALVLHQSRYGQDIPEGTLKDIVEDYLPAEILSEMKKLVKNRDSNTVYVIHNLPEIKRNELQDNWYDKNHFRTFEVTIGPRTYTHYIQQGISESLGLTSNGLFPMVRGGTWKRPKVTGGMLHTHPTDIDFLGGVHTKGNNAATRFTDFRTMTEEVKKHPVLGEIPLKIFRNKKKPVISDLDTVLTTQKWMEEGELNFGFEGKTPQAQKQLDKLAKKHSQEIVIGRGDLAIWPNNGKLFHQALLGNEDYLRVVVASGHNRQI